MPPHRHRIRRLALVALAVVAASGPVAACADGGGDASGPTPSGLPWPSGVFVAGGAQAGYRTFAEWRGRPLDVAVLWTDRATWPDLVDSWVYDEWADSGLTTVIGIPPYPTDVSGSLQDCASGAYDDEWRAIGTSIADAGIASRTIVRLGWEFNGDWYPWTAWDPDAFAECWRRAVGAAEEQAPDLRWDWTVNIGVGAGLDDPARAWPGDEWVDIVGVDAYDNWPYACDLQGWEANYRWRELGLEHWLAFAKEHDKPLSVPEWGTSIEADEDHACPDNAFFVERMLDFFRTNADAIAYEAYFNHADEQGRAALVGPGAQERAGAAYLDGLSRD
jgi:hypothetical protein